jgi:RNA polymerase sigma-70 factor (ECF subfamily)
LADPHGITDEALMEAFKQGDAAAFSELVARHEKPLWNFLRRSVRDNALAEDLMQEALMRVLRGAPGWLPSARFSTWLYTIARNLCVDHARRMVHRNTTSLDVAVGDRGGGGARTGGVSMSAQISSAGDARNGPRRIDQVVGPDRGGEAMALSREAGARIEAALADLPDEQREVFLMREVMDMAFADIAIAVEASLPTVKSRMRYALVRLRDALADLRESDAAPDTANARTAELP